MVILFGIGAYVVVAVVAAVAATMKAPQMAFDDATHPIQRCEVIEFPVDRFEAYEELRAA